MIKATLLAIFIIPFFAKAQKVELAIRQADERFTLSGNRYFSTLAGSEEYKFFLKNNTSVKYKLKVTITLDLACVGEKQFVLGVNKIITVGPNETFTPSKDYVHIYNDLVNEFKSCRIKDGKGFTLFKSLTYTYTDIEEVKK